MSNIRKSDSIGIGVSNGFNPYKVIGDFTLILWGEIKRVLASSIVLSAV